MLSDFRLPALGADMESGTVVQWNVAPGDAVKRGQVVAVVETDKGAIDVEIFEDGVVRQLVVSPGTKVPVGTVIARLETAAGGEPAAPQMVAPAPEAVVPEAVAPAAVPAPGRAKVSPAAAEGTVSGGMREAIAAAMSRSKREIPHYYLSLTADVTATSDWLAARNATVGVAERMLFAVLLVKAVALACREVPGFSGFHRDGRFEASPSVHVGVAVALRGGGLVAPATRVRARRPRP